MKVLIICLTGLITIGVAVIVIKIATGTHVKLFGLEINDQPKINTPEKPTVSQQSPRLIPNNDTTRQPKDPQKQIGSIKRHLVAPILEVKKTAPDTSKKYSKYDLTQATVTQSAVGDNAKVENYNGIKQRHLDSAMFINLMKRVEKFWDEHPNAERDVVEVSPSPDKDSRQLAAELVYYLKYNHIKVTHTGYLTSPVQSNNSENFDVGPSVDNKNVMVIVMAQPNVQ